jgi:amino acid transporter
MAEQPADGSPQRFGAEFRPRQAVPLPKLESFSVPEKLSYRIKNKLLGPPLVTRDLGEQRIGKPTALAILSSDVMSSSAYATEAMLGVLVPAVGLAAFRLVVPVSLLVVVVLVFVTASYLEVIRAYPKAGGAYMVARDTFGSGLARVAAAALFVDYILTVAVSISAGADALASAIPVLSPYVTAITVVFVVLIAYGNLRGIREAGRTFALPTYLFIGSMLLMIVVGLVRAVLGHLPVYTHYGHGIYPFGTEGGGLLLGASMFIFLKAFASGGTALTGTEAISNGVSVFKDPQPRNARITLVVMSIILGTLLMGVSGLAALTHASPYLSGDPTVLSQIASVVFGPSLIGRILFVALDIFTMGILTLAANTSFSGLPYLASFAAADGFLPKSFTRRGHRLVYSTAIVALAIVSIVLLVVTNSNVYALISLYAIGVFTGFTIAGVGMVRHHLREREDHWRRRAIINGASAVLSGLVDLTFIVTKFTAGAWTVVVIVPLLVLMFTRFKRSHDREEELLVKGLAVIEREALPRRHKALLFVDQVDVATLSALRYARILAPDELTALHFVLDDEHAAELAREWEARGLRRTPLELVDCQDRRLRRAAGQVVLDALADGDAVVSVLIPHRVYPRLSSLLVHDETAAKLAAVVAEIPNATPILIPHRVYPGKRPEVLVGASRASKDGEAPLDPSALVAHAGSGASPIGELAVRRRARIIGRVSTLRISSYGRVPSLTARVEDATGGLLLVFPGRRQVPGLSSGMTVVAEGTVVEVEGRLAMINPLYEFVSADQPPSLEHQRS